MKKQLLLILSFASLIGAVDLDDDGPCNIVPVDRPQHNLTPAEEEAIHNEVWAEVFKTSPAQALEEMRAEVLKNPETMLAEYSYSYPSKDEVLQEILDAIDAYVNANATEKELCLCKLDKRVADLMEVNARARRHKQSVQLSNRWQNATVNYADGAIECARLYALEKAQEKYFWQMSQGIINRAKNWLKENPLPEYALSKKEKAEIRQDLKEWGCPAAIPHMLKEIREDVEKGWHIQPENIRQYIPAGVEQKLGSLLNELKTVKPDHRKRLDCYIDQQLVLIGKLIVAGQFESRIQAISEAQAIHILDNCYRAHDYAYEKFQAEEMKQQAEKLLKAMRKEVDQRAKKLGMPTTDKI